MCLAWMCAGLIAFLLSWRLERWFENAQLGSITSAGFLGLILAIAIGGAGGGLATGAAATPLPGAGIGRTLAVGFLGFLGFGTGALVAILAVSILPELTKMLLGSVTAPTVAVGLGGAGAGLLGGLIAGAALSSLLPTGQE
jgi:hypothetical protein